MPSLAPTATEERSIASEPPTIQQEEPPAVPPAGERRVQRADNPPVTIIALAEPLWREATAVVRAASAVTSAVSAETRARIVAELTAIADATNQTVKVVHAIGNPHARMGFECGSSTGLGAIPIGDKAGWDAKQAQAQEARSRHDAAMVVKGMFTRLVAEGVEREAARAIVNQKFNAAFDVAMIRHDRCFEWLRRKRFDVHLDLSSDGPVALTKGVGSLAALQLFAIPDFRVLFPEASKYRRALKGIEKAVVSWPAFREYRLNDDYTVAEAMDEYSTASKHSIDFKHFHDYACCHSLATAGKAVMLRKKDRRTGQPPVLFPRFNTPSGGPAFRALLEGLMFPILPFLHEMRRRLTPARYHPKHHPATEIYNTGYTYVGMNFFVDGSKADEAPGFCLSAWYDPETKQAGGLMFHGDEANARFKHGAIAALGSWRNFFQFYPAYNTSLANQCFSAMSGDYSDLRHAVGPGDGFRVTFTLFDHEAMTTGVRPNDGGRVNFDGLYDPRSPAEQWEPDIEAIIDERLEREGG